MISRIVVVIVLIMQFMGSASAGSVQLEASFPHNIEQKQEEKIFLGSTNPLFFNIERVNEPEVGRAKLTIEVPPGLEILNRDEWQVNSSETGNVSLTRNLELEPNYCQKFGMLSFKATEGLNEIENILQISVEIDGKVLKKQIVFGVDKTVVPEAEGLSAAEKNNFNWYINKIVLPVDERGQRDDKIKEGYLYVRDTEFENLRNRMTGEGATNWAAVHNHPATHILIELANPKKDVKLLKFKAVLVDKNTGAVVPGLRPAGQTEEHETQGWDDKNDEEYATTALISLDGIKNQSFNLPLYVDNAKLIAGDYYLRIIIGGNGEEKVQEVPLTIAKKRSIGIFSVAFSVVCFLVLLAGMGKIKGCIRNIGAKGAITVALFAAVAFGSIVLPTTLAGDFFRVFLGPFSSLVTGLLSGTLLYLLLVALLVLYRKPGVIALFFLLKWLLAGIMFGRFTPLGLLSYAVYIVSLEVVLYCSGFYLKEQLNMKYMALVAVLLGMADAFITLINMEQMMFFYRLYYADWYIALYMLVNGLIYSSIGSLLGYRVGNKLEQIIGE